MRRRIAFIIGSFSFGLVFLMVVLRVTAVAANGGSFVPPILLDVFPEPNTHTAPLTGSITAFYDQPINPTTVNSQTFVVHAMQTGLLTEVYGVAGNVVVLNPILPFKPGELVQVVATTGTQNFGGEGPISPTVWQFRAEAPTGSGIFTDSGQSLTQVVELNTITSKLFSNNNRLGLEVYIGLDKGDVDLDGDLDIVLGSGGNARVWLNNGLGLYTDSGQNLDQGWVSELMLGDLDQDGDLDLIVVNAGSFPVYPDLKPKIWLNDGAGIFSYLTQTLPAIFANDAELGDMNGDGLLDLVIADHSKETEVWINVGGGYFTPSVHLTESHNTYGVDLGDLDQDGDLDIFSVTWEEDQVWFNNGDGTFQSSGQIFGLEPGAGIALGDLDSDGDLDGFVIGFSGWMNPTITHKVWINNGSGLFQDNGQTLSGLYSYDGDIVLGDIDADGDLDVYIGTEYYDDSNPIGQFDEVWLNDGNGNFVFSSQNLGPNYNRGVDFMDTDYDGDLDAVTGILYNSNSCGCTIAEAKLWLNENTIVPISGLSVESNSPVMLGEAAVMTATVSAGTGISYTWDFGDGTFGNGAVVSHFYTDTGTYTVTVTATNSVNTESITILFVVTGQEKMFKIYLPVALKP